jgi:5-methylcytosine-specific restriction protein A
MTSTAPADAAHLARDAALGVGPWGAAQWGALPRAELVAVHRELAALRRRVDAALAAASAEVARRSEACDGAASLARREGFATPARMVAASTGGSTAEAARLIAVGTATLDASRPMADDAALLDGAAGRPRFSHVADAVNGGRMSVDAASMITAALTRVADAAGPEALADAERFLVNSARELPLDRLAVVVRHVEARLDLEAHLRREQARYDERYLNIYENRAGVVVIDGRLDPETAAPVRAALDGLVTEALRRRRDDAMPLGDAAPLADQRTAPQMRADALADLARHALGCDATDRTLPTTTVVVRVGLKELRAGVGLGEIDGTDEPVSIGVIRRLAADAEVIPEVMGGESEVLDLGRSRRLFTRAQRLALVERDGGCAFCHAPPSWTEAHHIRWWERDAGPTDLDNAVLLCTACHHRVHRDGWDIRVLSGEVWFVPPLSVDRERQPFRGGRARFHGRINFGADADVVADIGARSLALAA